MSKLNFENLLDDRLFTTAELLGFLDKEKGDGRGGSVYDSTVPASFDTSWFSNPEEQIKAMFGGNKRQALQKFVTDILGSSNSWLEGGAPTEDSHETWHSIPKPDKSPSGLYLVFNHAGDDLIIGLGGVYQATLGTGVEGVDISLSGSVPVAKVDSNGGWSMVLGETTPPSCFSLRLQSTAGNLLEGNPLISLAGVSLKLTLGASIDVDLLLEQLKLPGEEVPRSRTLAELGSSFNLSFVLNMFLDGLTDGIANPLRNLLGMAGGFPTLDWDRLATGDATSLRDWFNELCFGATPKIKAWLAEFAQLLGLESPVIKGDGTREDPWYVPLSMVEEDVLAKLHLTLAVESAGQPTAYPGIRVAFAPFALSPMLLHASARSELVAINLNNGAIDLLPSLSLDLKLTGESKADGSGYLDLIPAEAGADIALSSPAVSLSAELGFISAGLAFAGSQGLSATLQLHDVDINGRYFDIMDLNSMEAGLDSALDAARDMVVEVLRDAVGIHPEVPSFASRIGALVGLNAPLSAPDWQIELVVDGDYLMAFLNDPLQAVAWYHSRAVDATVELEDVGEISAYHYLMQDLYVLLNGSGTLGGYGTQDAPWLLPLSATAPTINLTMVADTTQDVPRLQIDLQAHLRKILDENKGFALSAAMQIRVVDILLPEVERGLSPARCTWLNHTQLGISFGDLPSLTMGSITIDASSLTGSIGWSRVDGLVYDLALVDLELTYQGRLGEAERAPFSWGTLSLPRFGFGGDDSGWLAEGNLASFGPILLELYGQWLASISPKGFALAGLLGLLPDMAQFQLADSRYPTWDKSPWGVPEDWPALDFDDWNDLFDNPWDGIKRHLALVFSKPQWALPGLRWLGAFCCDCLPDLSMPDVSWGLGKDDQGDRKRFPTLAELPFMVTGHGTYEEPWKLQVKEAVSAQWHKGAVLVWLDPDGPPVLDISSMAALAAPHLAGTALGTADDILTAFDLDGMVDLAGKIGMVNQEVARHCKGFDAQITEKLVALEAWLQQADGFGRLPLVEGHNLLNNRLQNVTPLADLAVASLDQQLDHFSSALDAFVNSIANDGTPLRLLLVGDEHTSVEQWQTLLHTKMGLAPDAIGHHDFCQFGVAPDQQALGLDPANRATIVKLTALNTAPDQFGWLPMDRLQDSSPAQQLQRVLDHLQMDDGEKIIIISHASAGFAARVVLDAMAEPSARIAGMCAVGMPDVVVAEGQPFGLDPASVPGVIAEELLLGVDFLQGLLGAGQTEMHSALSQGLELLADWYGSGNSYGYAGSIMPEQLPPRGASLFANIPALPDQFSDVVCKGFYSRLLATVEDGAAGVYIKGFLMDWLAAQLGGTVADGSEPSHVGFGLSWEDDHSFGAEQEFSMHSQTRFDILRVGLAAQTSEEGLQPLPRTRFALDVHRRDGWLVGGRNQDIRCRWMEFSLDVSPGACGPDVVFHDAGVNGGQLQRLGLKSLNDTLWTAENEIRVLLQKMCAELPAPAVCAPLSCFMTGSGLFYEENGRLLPHVNSWQAVLIEPKGYFTTLIQTGLSDPTSDEARGFACIIDDLFSLDEAPFIKQLITIMTSCGTDPEARICLLVMQALELFEQTQQGCLPVVLNWLRLVQNPKLYLQTKWAAFTVNTPDAQAKRAVLVAEIAVEIQNLSAGVATSPKWLHDLAFDGNQVSFYLGGDGFEFLNHGMRLRIPVVVDFINGYVQVRFELDASGVIGVALPSGSGRVFGGINVFFDLLVQTNPDQARLLYGLDFGGGAVFDLAESSHWQQVLRRLLTQGLSTQFLARIKDQFHDPHLQSFIGCFADRGIPASLDDAKAYFDAGSVCCLLNSTGDMLEVRTRLSGVGQNSWDLGDFLFAYPVCPNPDDLELQLSTRANGLELYDNDPDRVELHALLGLVFPAEGEVRVSGDCQLVTRYTGIDVDFFCHYTSRGGTLCTITAQGVEIGLYPFTGLADILGSMDALLEQCLQPLLRYLQGGDGSQLRFKVCNLATLFCTQLTALRDDPLDWLVARFAQADVRTELNDLFAAYGLHLNVDGVLEYRYNLDDLVSAEESTHVLQLRLGPGVGALGTDCGFSFVFSPLPIANIALHVEAACWADTEQQFQVRSLVELGLAPNVLVAGGVSIEPTVHFSFDSSTGGDTTSLQLTIPNPEGDAFVSLHLLPSFRFELNGSVRQLVEPLLNGVLGHVQVKKWLNDGEYTIGQILIALKLLRQEDESYAVASDFDLDWQDPRAILERIIFSALDLLGERRLVEFGDNDGGLYLCKDGNWYGLRVVHSGIRVCNDPEIDLVLGRDTDWITGKGCGLSESGRTVQAPGLSVFLLEKTSTTVQLGCRFVLSDVGLFFRGKGEQNLFDVKGCTLKGLALRGYVDLDLLTDAPVCWALGCECIDFGLPISNAAGSGNPVAGSLLASSSGDAEPINPAFDISFAYGDHFSAFIGDKDSNDGVAWMNISKQFGPVYIQSLGIKLVNAELAILIDGKVEMMGLAVAVDDLSLTLSLAEPFNTEKWELDCQGLGVSYVSDGLVVSGALLKKEDASGIEYCGVCTIETGGTTFSAFGAYKQMGSDPSLFVFVVLNMPIGGPPMFFIRGFAGGFGYNRDFLAPTIDNVSDFSLVQLATGESHRDPLALLADDSFPPTRGAYWFAAGVKFTTFELFKSFGLLYVLLNRGLEIGLLGRTELEFPEEKPLVHVVMNFKARFSTADGCLEARAQLTNDSWLFDPNCKLQGGFALASWFAGAQKGDFVITLGGYHAEYAKPEHYPDVPRIGFNWQVSSSVSIKGSSYFALTSNAVMAGGKLDASYKSGALEAWFEAWANLLIQWKPFFYSFEVGVTIGASYRMSVRLPWVGRVSKTFKAELGGELKIWGPDFAGVATLDWCIISVSIPFGANTGKPDLPPLTWDEFCREFLPSEKGDEKYISLHPEKGLLEDQDGQWLLKSECIVRTETVFPTTSTKIGGLGEVSHGKKIDLKPMQLALVSSTHIFSITEQGGSEVFTQGRWKQQDGDEPVYIRYVNNKPTVARMAITFDTQEVAKALWEFDVDADPLAPGNPLKGDMGMSVRFYIDNATVLSDMHVVSLDQNDTSDCVMPILFTSQWKSLIPEFLRENWLDRLPLDSLGGQGRVVAALYSAEWLSRRQAAVADMRGQGAALTHENDLVGSRLHHLLKRTAMPKVATLYDGFSDVEQAEEVILFGEQEAEDEMSLNWSLAVISLPMRYGDEVAALVTHIKTINDTKSLAVVHLDPFTRMKSTSGGRMLKADQSRYGGRVMGDQIGRVLNPRGRAGGYTQRALQEQLYNGLDSGKRGAVLKAGMVHIWKTTEEVGPLALLAVDGTQATRICCFDRGGGVLYDEESVGARELSLPEDTRMVTLTGLGRSSLPEKTKGGGAVSLHSHVDQQPLCGWSSGDILPQINGHTLLCRGAVLHSADHFMFQAEPALVNVATFLKKRSRCVTRLPVSVQTVAVLVARSEEFSMLDDDINISFPETCSVTLGQTISYGNSLLCLYGVKVKAGGKDACHLSVEVQGRNGWMLAGVFGGEQDLKFWQTSMDLSVPPTVNQDICAGPASEVFLSQDGLTKRLERYQKKIEKQAEKRKNYADIWKRKTV